MKQECVIRAVATGVLMGLAVAANASVIEFSTRVFPAGDGTQASAAAYQSYVEGLMAVAPGAGYCDSTPAAWDGLSNQATCGGSANNIAFEISAEFTVGGAEAGAWSIRVGPDFGFGGALFLDGVAIGFRSTDMWWNGGYGAPSQIFEWSGVLGAGTHLLEAYGMERCCDGAQQAQYLASGATSWTTFSTTDGRNPVPEPATLALLGLGLAGLGVARRR